MSRSGGHGLKLVFFSEIKWSYLRTRKQQMIRCLPKDWQILFVEPYTLGRENRFQPQREGNLTYLTVPYFKNFSQRWLQALLRIEPLRGAVILAITGWVWMALRATGFRQPDIVLVSNIYYAPVITRLVQQQPVVYDCNDHPLAFPNTPAWASRYFRSLCHRADKIVCCSHALGEIVPPHHRHKTVFIGNGVDTALFRDCTVARPEAMSGLPEPILLYLGALSEWVDYTLLQQVAQSHPDKTLVLVGPVARPVHRQIEPLLQLPNVRYLGEVSPEAIAGYIVAADVCLMPFVKNELTRALNPNKFYEYLAAGKPVVSVDMSPDVTALKEEIFLAADHASFVRQIDTAVQAGHSRVEARKRIASANTWQHKADQMVELILNLKGDGANRLEEM